ncbi:enoyl-CoA hydratase-related protein [Phaeobacter gallaeciensis]|jgi:enoyl-CoA hydratase|uniref:Enoyl-CoA hydratase-related protein n=1 Tax=Phaeobacter gallaeciensis TaxID=60890 RepID=A0ABD4XF36_9RHOB|nr:enoyl-CoA hydratase-related protein [Phaeobacter gallaeciensis]MDE4142216.1 enoyl-CoA hydratase-related protein [Phaeobacter gallaeciensis]MDE4146588.1 enoyl-CoA hydratase-related protein [Phaeobacter gallaeciensis]MDE4150661.1 enoyl-CoA hydratase-related protein [Phaeobacter gallaeciensis]MDE4154840.1 enoyl-CoA hydratase-related protein [Phaeobacter gallaeciensis]MDE4159270.1 enoyl-CoA hydratase-related protein [Phaeobacter gallaeciensis]
MSGLIEITRKDRVALLRLNRPEQLNALNEALAAELIAAVTDLDADSSVGCIVITGSERAFAAGADISEMVNMSAEEMSEKDYFGEWMQFVTARTPKIAAVQGYALGGGCELMMMCDFAIAGQGAKFGQPEVKLGVVAAIGGTQRMTKLIGRARAMDMHLTGRMMDAEEALSAGLIARVVPDEDVLPEALKAAALVSDYSRPAVRLAREAVMRAEESSLSEGLLYERRMFHKLFGTKDQLEGMTAFLEKRVPNFW